jgi:hypothetical protein
MSSQPCTVRKANLPSETQNDWSDPSDALTSVSLTPNAGSFVSQPSRWLLHRATGDHFSHPSLQVLFCTWLA